MSKLGASIHAGVPWPWRVGRKVRSSIGALGNRASTNERMRARATAPSGPVNGIPSMTPMSAMFIGAVAVSAQSAHKSGTGTRTIDAGSVASVWGTFEALCSTRVFTLRRSWSKVRCIHQPNAGVSRRRNPWGARFCAGGNAAAIIAKRPYCQLNFHRRTKPVLGTTSRRDRCVGPGRRWDLGLPRQ
jgi:hypothetical protein